MEFYDKGFKQLYPSHSFRVSYKRLLEEFPRGVYLRIFLKDSFKIHSYFVSREVIIASPMGVLHEFPRWIPLRTLWRNFINNSSNGQICHRNFIRSCINYPWGIVKLILRNLRSVVPLVPWKVQLRISPKGFYRNYPERALHKFNQDILPKIVVKNSS